MKRQFSDKTKEYENVVSQLENKGICHDGDTR